MRVCMLVETKNVCEQHMLLEVAARNLCIYMLFISVPSLQFLTFLRFRRSETLSGIVRNKSCRSSSYPFDPFPKQPSFCYSTTNRTRMSGSLRVLKDRNRSCQRNILAKMDRQEYEHWAEYPQSIRWLWWLSG